MPTFDTAMLWLFIISGVVFLAILGFATLLKLKDRTPDDLDDTTPISNGNYYINDFLGDE